MDRRHGRSLTALTHRTILLAQYFLCGCLIVTAVACFELHSQTLVYSGLRVFSASFFALCLSALADTAPVGLEPGTLIIILLILENVSRVSENDGVEQVQRGVCVLCENDRVELPNPSKMLAEFQGDQNDDLAGCKYPLVCDTMNLPKTPVGQPSETNPWIDGCEYCYVFVPIFSLVFIAAWNWFLSAIGLEHRRWEPLWLLDTIEASSAFLDRLAARLRRNKQAIKAQWKSSVQRRCKVQADIEKQGKVIERASRFNAHYLRLAAIFFAQFLVFFGLLSGAVIMRYFLHDAKIFAISSMLLCVFATVPLGMSAAAETTLPWMEPETVLVMIFVMDMPAEFQDAEFIKYLCSPGFAMFMIAYWDFLMSEIDLGHVDAIGFLEVSSAAFKPCSAFLGFFILRLENKADEVQERSGKVQKGGKGGTAEGAGAIERKSGNDERPESTTLDGPARSKRCKEVVGNEQEQLNAQVCGFTINVQVAEADDPRRNRQDGYPRVESLWRCAPRKSKEFDSEACLHPQRCADIIDETFIFGRNVLISWAPATICRDLNLAPTSRGPGAIQECDHRQLELRRTFNEDLSKGSTASFKWMGSLRAVAQVLRSDQGI
ncbi:hypothetical protein FB45DRAFT_1144646 [Roridomyces roridus]|uniref:Uncharacterized protein n=1 Tax=Roridomyces roridus TaxID=1738132 RepID=A0AAD7AZR7_9AGAR|nr:hypothetical protein FB45DRAFT_1144646 [Roridomyces roridus]